MGLQKRMLHTTQANRTQWRSYRSRNRVLQALTSSHFHTSHFHTSCLHLLAKRKGSPSERYSAIFFVKRRKRVACRATSSSIIEVHSDLTKDRHKSEVERASRGALHARRTCGFSDAPRS